MTKKKRVRALWIWALLINLLVFVSNVQAITIKEEKELSREFLKVVATHYQIIEDPIITDYVNKVGQKILAVLPPQPFTYHFYVIKEDTFNAFASPAGHIFINSGLFESLDSEAELAGIIGHEISHVVCRHISQRIERSKKINMAAMAGMVAGIFLGAGGAAAAGNAVAIGSLATGQSLALSYSREDERQADEIGLQYLNKAGYGGEGLLTSLEKIRSKQWFGSDQIPHYLLTHPASEDRMAYIGAWLSRHRMAHKDTLNTQSTSDNKEFQRVTTRLVANYTESTVAMARFKSQLSENNNDAMTHYGLGMLFSRLGEQNKAIEHMKRALELSALDPYFLIELGQIYFAQGRYNDAVSTLTGATAMVDDPDGKFFLGRATMELGKLDQAIQIFEDLIQKKNDYNQAYYYLGESYGKLEKLGDAHFNLGIYYYNKGDLKNTRFHLSRALKQLDDASKRQKAQQMIDKLPKSRRQALEEPSPAD